MNRSVIIVPYADNASMRSGVNINDTKRVDIYLKNCCVSCLSIKKYNQDSDVALVTNIDIPAEYKKRLNDNEIQIIRAEFDTFKFPNEYKWGLAFYKLCALKHLVDEYEYEFYAYLDSDTYVQAGFEPIWRECKDHILLYDINHGLYVRDYNLILKEFQKFTNSDRTITHYGGEFFAASRENARIFLSECENIYSRMISEEFWTSFGDEFIISQAAETYKRSIKNAGAYIYRFWTGNFRLVSTCYRYNPVVVLHVPDEKNQGMLRIYRSYCRTGKLPSNEKVYRLLCLTHRRPIVALKNLVKRLMLRIR